MRSRIQLFIALALLCAIPAGAQQRPIFDPDDFVDPRHHDTPIFISRVVVGAMRSAIDDYRPLGQDAGFLSLTNSIYWSRFQVDYKHSEVRGENANGPAHVQVCPCDPPIYFPTPPSREETPAPPLPGAKDALQFGWYQSRPAGPADPPVMLRTRLSVSWQKVDTMATFLDTGHAAFRLHGHEQSIGLDRDIYFRAGGHDIFGSFLITRTKRSGTADDRSQNEITYISRFPAKTIGRMIVRGTLTFGGVSGRGTNGVNVINPAFEAFLHNWTTQANFHLIWSPIALRDGKGWQTHHQILLSVDRALFIKLLAHH